LIIVLIVL